MAVIRLPARAHLTGLPSQVVFAVHLATSDEGCNPKQMAQVARVDAPAPERKDSVLSFLSSRRCSRCDFPDAYDEVRLRLSDRDSGGGLLALRLLTAFAASASRWALN